MDDLIDNLKEKLYDFDYKKYIIPTILLLIYVAGFTYLYTIINNKKEKNISEINIKEVDINNEESDNINEIYIDIKGYVNKPGVYKMKSDSRVIDAINESGGLKKDANTRFVNLSKKLNDEDVIVIYSNSEIKKAQKQDIVYVDTPCVCEEVKNNACFKEEKTNSNGKININTSTLEELKTLSGIGDVKAKAIIEYRNKNGKFKSIQELLNVSGITESIYAKIKENITV